jgi:sec-independent protein translocase protein TatA
MNLEKPWHILVLIIVAVVLFGSKRLPDSARSLGRSLRIFKSEMKELNKDDNDADGEKKPNSNK